MSILNTVSQINVVNSKNQRDIIKHMADLQSAERAQYARMFTNAMYSENYHVVRECIGNGMDYIVNPNNPNEKLNMVSHKATQRYVGSQNSVIRNAFDRNGQIDKIQRIAIEDILSGETKGIPPLSPRMHAFVKNQVKAYKKRQKNEKTRRKKNHRSLNTDRLEQIEKKEREEAHQAGLAFLKGFKENLDKSIKMGAAMLLYKKQAGAVDSTTGKVSWETIETRAFTAEEFQGMLMYVASLSPEIRESLGYPKDFKMPQWSQDELSSLESSFERNASTPTLEYQMFLDSLPGPENPPPVPVTPNSLKMKPSSGKGKKSVVLSSYDADKLFEPNQVDKVPSKNIQSELSALHVASIVAKPETPLDAPLDVSASKVGVYQQASVNQEATQPQDPQDALRQKR